MKEIWKDIKGYEGLYQVSNLGRVKSLNHIRKNGKSGEYIQKGKVLQNLISCCRYYQVGLSKNGSIKFLTVHRLVAEAFIPNPENKPQVNHIDGNKLNNCIDNLEWCTRSENQLHAWKNGLQMFTDNQLKSVTKNGISLVKPVNQYDKNKNFIKRWSSMKEVERSLKIPNSCITDCCKGRRKTAGGYIWEYAN